jgi:calcineurin-like phosphoesterase family protein
MNAALIAIWNKQVQPEDNVYHLGDFVFGGLEKLESILAQLNGRKHFIVGNHDDRKHWSRVDKEKYNIAWVRDTAHVKVDGESMEMCHFPFLLWNRSHHGVWNLHGHCHGTLPEQPSKQLDVGIDRAFQLYGEYRLFDIDDLKAYMANKPIQVLDHHDGDTH